MRVLKHDKRNFYVLLTILGLLGLFLRTFALGNQPPIADEMLALFSEENYLRHGVFGPIMIYHPNLRSFFIYVTTSLLGNGAWGLRAASVCLGVLSIPVLGLLVRKITRNDTAALIAAGLLMLDPVHITFSRQAIQEVHTAFFFLSGVLLFLHARERDTSSAGPLWLYPLAGVLFGLGFGSKSHTLFPWMICCIVALFDLSMHKNIARTVYSLASLIALPFVVYLLTYAPWFMRGYGFGDWIFMQRALFDTMVHQPGNPMDSLIDTNPWQWFIRPLMGYANFAEIQGELFVTIAMGNPLAWLLVLPSSVYVFLKRRGLKGALMMQALFWSAYVPLATASRPIWVLSSIAVTPFAFGLVGMAAAAVTQASEKRRKVLYLYFAAMAVVTMLMYPMAIGHGWHFEYLRGLVSIFNPH